MLFQAVVVAVLLAVPSTAWAAPGVDPNAVGAIVAALITALGGTGIWYQRHRTGLEGREHLTAKAAAAIARDNADQILQDRLEHYQSTVDRLESKLDKLSNDVTLVRAIATSAKEDVSRLQSELHDHKRDQSLERLLAPLQQLHSRLDRAIEVTERKGGGRG